MSADLDDRDVSVGASRIRAFWQNFLGQSPEWYKTTIIAFLIFIARAFKNGKPDHSPEVPQLE